MVRVNSLFFHSVIRSLVASLRQKLSPLIPRRGTFFCLKKIPSDLHILFNAENHLQCGGIYTTAHFSLITTDFY